MRKIAPEDIFEFSLVGDIAIHPKRADIIYCQARASAEGNSTDHQLMRVVPGEAPLPYTQGPSDSHPRYSPNGKWLAFLSKRSGSEQIWMMATDGGEARKISDIKGGVSEFAWLPDSQHLVAIALLGSDGILPESTKDPDDPYLRFNQDVKVITEIRHKLDGQGYFSERRPHLVFVSIQPDQAPVQLTRGPMRHQGLAVSPDGRFVLTQSRYGEDYDLHASHPHLFMIDLHQPEHPEELTDDPWAVEQAVFSPDGQSVYFLASDWTKLGYDNVALFHLNLSDRSLRRVAATWDRPFVDVSLSDMPAPASVPMRFDASTRTMYLLTSINGATQLAAVNLWEDTVDLVTPEDQVFYSYEVSADGRLIVLATSSPTDPSQLVIWDGDSQALHPLATPNQELLAGLEIAKPERFAVTSPDGTRLDGFVMRPPDSSPGVKVPTVLEIHGGPMMMYAQAFFFEFQWLAAQGWAVVYGNPRGSQGYGQAFCEAILPRWGHLDYQDIMATLDTAIDQFDFIDPDRLAVMGGSYGGYMTNWIVGHTTRFKAAITMRSVVDWRSLVGTGDLGWHWVARAQNRWPWDEEDSWYREQSPITYVGNITTPLLIEHQEGDLRCPIEQGEMLYTAMQYFHRAPVKFIRYPDEFHGMSRNGKPWHRVYRLNTLSDWLATYLT